MTTAQRKKWKKRRTNSNRWMIVQKSHFMLLILVSLNWSLKF